MGRMISLSKLRSSIWENFRSLEFNRKSRREILDKYGGPAYGQGSNRLGQPINLIELGFTTYATNLVPLHPKAHVKSWDPEQVSTALNLKLACDQVAREMDLSEELEDCLLNANCGLGVMEVGLQRDPTIDWRYDNGRVFAESISMDDWIHDTTARKWGECYYYGRRVSMDVEDLLDSDEYPKKAVKEAWQYASNEKTNSFSDYFSGSTTATLGPGDGYSGELLFRELNVWKLYFPRQKVYMVLPCEGGPPLTVRTWTGERNGPFRFLRLGKMPDNLIGLSPGVLWLDQCKWINNIWRKLQDQAERQKMILAYRDMKSKEDCERAAKSRDSAVTLMHDPNKINIFQIPGVDQTTFAFALNVLDRWSHDAGNMDLMAGLGAQSDTLGQDQLLQANSSSRMNYLKGKMNRFISEVFSSIGYELWTDPNLSVKVTHTDSRTGAVIPKHITQANLHGMLEDYNFSIEPYSTGFMSQQERRDFLMMVFTQVVMPAMQGGFLEQIAPLTQKLGELQDMPEVREVFGGMMPIVPRTGQMSPLGSANTTRTENRISHPQATPQGHSQNMQQLMMTAKNGTSQNGVSV